VVPLNGGPSRSQVAQKRGVVGVPLFARCQRQHPAPRDAAEDREGSGQARPRAPAGVRRCAETTLTWLWVARVPGQPAATRTHTWHKGTSGESLRQKLGQIVWALEEEEAITLTDVIKGLRSAFDRDRVSKRFYERFKAEHEAFSDFIDGIEAAPIKPGTPR
jgi:hypothetical protein